MEWGHIVDYGNLSVQYGDTKKRVQYGDTKKRPYSCCKETLYCELGGMQS